MTLRVLFVGGTGQISLPCVQQAVAAGHDVSVLNRGSGNGELPGGARQISSDFRDDVSYAAAAQGHYDVVCQFILFEPQDAQRDVALFAGRTGQYIFISSASAYKKPATIFPITEDVPLGNPFWQYSQKKAACETILMHQDGLPVTIVRPSHTVRTRFPTAFSEGDTLLARLIQGKPVIVPGDGTSLWTLTRAEDFAAPFIRLFGKQAALGKAFHLTSDNAFTWNTIYQAIGRAVGRTAELVHVPTDNLIRFNTDWEGPLLGDKAHSTLFDNSRIQSITGAFSCESDIDRILEPVARHWHANGGTNTTQASSELDALFDTIINAQKKVLPQSPSL